MSWKDASAGCAERAADKAEPREEGGKAAKKAPQSVRNAKAPAKKKRGAAKRNRADLIHRAVRFGVQLVFFVLAPALFSGAFNAVKYFCSQVGAGQAIQGTSFVLLLILVLAFTVVFGRFFCGFACAFGTLGDVLYAVFEFVRSKTPLPRIRFPQGLVRVLSLGKFVVLGGICACCFFGVWQAYSGYSPWVAFAAVLSGQVEGVSTAAFALLGAIAVGMIVRERFFCQFLCPLGAVFSLMPVFGFSEYTRVRAHCARKCGRCHDACPVSIWPDADRLEHGECIACGRCADACPMANVNLAAVEKAAARAERLEKQGDEPKPLRKTSKSWYLVRGTGVAYTVAKALALLALCWVAGVTRYVPAFADVFGPVTLPF